MDPIQAALDDRAARRARRAAEKAMPSEVLKRKGDDAFRRQEYVDAIHHYTEAGNAHGGDTNPLIYLNMAAVFLKTDCYDLAEEAASNALALDPKLLKARFRRGVARKGLYRYMGAMADFRTILEHDPSCSEAKDELTETFHLWGRAADVDSDELEYEEWEFNDPPYDAFTSDPYSDSDTSDCLHTGNDMGPCYDYNHDGCEWGASCEFSHAPHAKSVRDRLGKNVCTLFILGLPDEYEPCAFSHDTTYLPEKGWWADPKRRNAMRMMHPSQHAGLSHARLSKMAADAAEAFSKEPSRYRTDASQRIKDHVPPVAGRGSTAFALQRSQFGNTTGTATAPTTKRQPFVLHLSLENLPRDSEENFANNSGSLFWALRDRTRIVEALTAQKALKDLSDPDLAGVFVTDAAIAAPRHAEVLQRLVEYASDGGVVVLGGSFGKNIQGSVLNDFFRRAWGVPWTAGTYYAQYRGGTVATLNPGSGIYNSNPSLKPSYRVEGLCLKGFAPSAAVYQAMSAGGESPVVHTRVGNGYLGYIADFLLSKAAILVLYAMLGLPMEGPNDRRDAMLMAEHGMSMDEDSEEEYY